MTDVQLPPKARSLIDKALAILTKPKEAWTDIAAEPATVQGLFTGYALLMAAVPAVAALIGLIVFGWYGYHSVTLAVSVAVGLYIASLLAVALLGFVLNLLAPQFGAKQDSVAAFKLAIYSMTGFWVAGLVYLLPGIGALASLGGLYGVYLAYVGAPILMPAAADKAQTWAIVVIIATLVAVGIPAGSGQSGAVWGGVYADNSPTRPMTGRVDVPNYGSVDLNRAEAAQKAADAAIAAALAANGQSGAPGTVTLTSAEELGALLPGTMAGFTRGEVTATTSSAQGMSAAQARADYSRADSKITLSVTDMGRAAAFAQLGSAFDVNHSEASGGKYEKIGMVGGRLTTEKYDSAERSGAYSVVVGERFMVEASGTNVDMTALKAAVISVGFAHLERLAHQA